MFTPGRNSFLFCLAAVGPFAIDENLIKGETRPGSSADENLVAREVRIYNTGTQKVLIAHVPIDLETGKSISEGDFAIAAVPGTGAPILMDYRDVSAQENMQRNLLISSDFRSFAK
jgi:2-methylaconitate cis-trans-isomerase PrpF